MDLESRDGAALASRATLFARLRAEFPERRMEPGARGSSIVATFGAPHPQARDLVVEDDGEGITLWFAGVTHVHFRDDDDRVLAFLRDVFADRIEFYRAHFWAGCRPRAPRRWRILARILLGHRGYVWSGPLR